MSHTHNEHCRCPKPAFLVPREGSTGHSEALSAVLRLTRIIHDRTARPTVRREARARRAVLLRRYGITVIKFPPRRPGEPEHLDAPADPGRLQFPHCARATADPATASFAKQVQERLCAMGPVPDVEPPEVVYVHCGRPTCTACAVAEA